MTKVTFIISLTSMRSHICAVLDTANCSFKCTSGWIVLNFELIKKIKKEKNVPQVYQPNQESLSDPHAI